MNFANRQYRHVNNCDNVGNDNKDNYAEDDDAFFPNPNGPDPLSQHGYKVIISLSLELHCMRQYLTFHRIKSLSPILN